MTDSPQADVVVTKRDDRFALTVDGQPAGMITYRDNHDVRAMPHTEVDPAFQGRGLATVLITAALDQTRAEGLHVLPMCPAIAKYIRTHAEYADLVPEAQRAAYGVGGKD